MKEGTLFKGETMPKILLTSIIAMFAIMPVFAETKDGLTCDASGVGATTANAKMKASWTPNKYTLQWYDDVNSSTPLTVQSAAQTCNYGSTLVLPSTNPPKLGYTFIGWELEEKNDCGLSSLDTRIVGSSYGIDVSSITATTNFSYGKITLEPLCSSTVGTDNTAGTPDTTNSGVKCWCRVVSYTPTNSTQCTPNNTNWVYVDRGKINACTTGACAQACGERTVSTNFQQAFLNALYGK